MTAFTIGAARIDPSDRTVAIDGQTRRISPKALAVLNALTEANGGVVSRGVLIEQVWPDVYVGEEVLTQAITELRRAFGDAPKAPRYIGTVPKTGYRLLRKPTPSVNEISSSPILPIEGEPALEPLLAYMSASDLLERRGRKNIDEAIELFHEAIGREPDFALAHAGLSTAITYRHNFYEKSEDAPQAALAYAQQAVRIDRTASESYTALGYALSQVGDFDHAVTSFSAALRLRPDAYYATTRLGRTLFLQKRYSEAASIFDRASNLRGDDAHSVMSAAKARRAAGDNDRATEGLKLTAWRCEQRLAHNPDDLRALVCMACCVIELEGIAYAATLIERLMNEDRPFTYYLAGALAQAGETDLALNRFEASVDNGWADPHFLESDRDLDPLRGEQRFQKIANALAA
ncbi:MAG: winged helix-turn-helix domain-containing protein [Pseudomonadota bacterium]